MDGRKVSANVENPIDNLILIVGDPLIKFFHYLHFTPNMLTTISILFSYSGVYSVYLKNYKIGALLFFIGYMFDCFDGNYARRYDMVTVFGDYYDHVGDISKIILLMYVIYHSKLKTKLKVNGLIGFTILFVLMMVHFGCQEKIYNKESSLTLTKKMCYHQKYIHISKFFGSGTFMALLSIFIYNLKYLNKLY